MRVFEWISLLAVCSGFVSALIIAWDIFRGHRQPMRIMDAVWPLTGLWSGIFGLIAYYRFGRAHGKSRKRVVGAMVDELPRKEVESCAVRRTAAPERPEMNRNGSGSVAETVNSMPGMKMDTKGGMPGMKAMAGKGPKRFFWQQVTLSTLHCGAGCTLADLIGEWFVFVVPVTIAGSLIAGQWVLDYLLALLIGVGFQYAAIRGMRQLSKGRAAARALRVDFLSLTAWQVGMYAWMAVVLFVFFPGNALPKTHWGFWFMMQVAMGFGFLTAYPVNRWLVKKGIKQAM